jgi:hypothetical protein
MRLRDILSGKILLGRRPTGRRPPCTPDLPKDPPPVKPGEPWCSTGPDVRVLEKNKSKGSGK